MNNFTIRHLVQDDIDLVTEWSRNEGFAPGLDDINIYRNTDRQGLWVGCLDDIPIGTISAVKYNNDYGFIGLYLVLKEHRGKGYGLKLWGNALSHMRDIKCVGLEAAPNRVSDYEKSGFKFSSITTRWKLDAEIQRLSLFCPMELNGIRLMNRSNISHEIVQNYDSKREESPRPHFLSYWLDHSSGEVFALLDGANNCHGFGRIRPCLLESSMGWRIGPLVANTKQMAQYLLSNLVHNRVGSILIDSPASNPNVNSLLIDCKFEKISQTHRMYKGQQPPLKMEEVYALACLELG